MRDQVTTHTHDPDVLPDYTRMFFPPRHTPARLGSTYQVQVTDPSQLHDILTAAARSQILAVDFETRGTDYSESCICDTDTDGCRSSHIVGVGLAYDLGSAYLPYAEMPQADRNQLIDMILAHRGKIAHNLYFDGGVLLRETDNWSTHWTACTLALYRLLSNEGWAGQTYGLKGVMTEILLWGDTNEDGIDTWLVRQGYYVGNRRVETDPDLLEAAYHERAVNGARKLRPNKAEMWRVPHEILGPYCVLDAEATYLFFVEHLVPVLTQFPQFWENYRTDWQYLIDKHIEQKMVGIPMDRKGLESRKETLIYYMFDKEQEFLHDERVIPHVDAMEAEMRQDILDKEPARYIALKPEPKEPPQYKKNGGVSSNWTKWKEFKDSGKWSVPILSKNWINWQDRLDQAVRGNLPAYRFNIQSKVQLAELLYRRLGYPIKILTVSEEPGTGADALAQMGDLGKILIDRDDALKELGFIERYLELMNGRDTIHPSFQMPGTSTGRLSSKDPNLQQIKKTKAMMDLFVARPGHTWIDLDFAALEPTVTTEFSKDKNMEAIYGQGARPNDIYLFVAYSVPQWRPLLEAVGYDPYSPSKESVARAKAECKHIRKIAKVVTLACAYGAGVDKIHLNLTNDGMVISREEVEQVHKGYWELFAEVKAYGYGLQDSWWDKVDLDTKTKEMYKDWSKSRYKRDKIPRNTVGYVMNGMGRPMCVTHDYKKDTLNRFIQSTGHDILVRYVRLVGQELDRRAIPWYPVVVDFHDAMAVEVPDRYVDQTIEVYMDSLDELNRQLGGDIQLKGTPSMGKNMAGIKEPES